MPAIYLCDRTPGLVLCNDLSQWKQYEDRLYQIFKEDFIDDCPLYLNHPVKIRRHPLCLGREESFYHVICNHYEDLSERQPDLERCARICWVRYFIENYDCTLKCCDKCDGLLIWEEPWKETKRVHILLEVERYIVVLEKRQSYNLLITAYYIEHDHSLRKLVKRFERYKEMQ